MNKANSKISSKSSVVPELSQGAKSRAAILSAAAELGTLRGLDGLSIGELATHLGMSKSGLYAHFKSKLELQLAAIQTAGEIFEREVLRPAMEAPAGARRLLVLAEEFLSHLERKVFPGGCFFASVIAEMDTQPGAVRDRVMEILGQWMGLLEECVREGQKQGEIDAAADTAQVAFEAEAAMLAANMMFVASGDPKKLTQGRRGVEHALERVGYRARSTPRRAARS